MNIRELIKPTETLLPLTTTLHDMTQMFVEYLVKYVYIVGDKRRFRGVVALKDITSNLLDRQSKEEKRAADFLTHDLYALTSGMPLGTALEHFIAHQGERLPVVESDDDPVLLRVVYKTSLLEAYVRMSHRE